MNKECKFKNLIIDYIYNELKGDALSQFNDHINGCDYCSEYLNKFSDTTQLLLKRKRPLPDTQFLKKYHQNLKNIYASENSILNWLHDFYNFYILQPSWGIRIVEVTAVLIIGVLLGWSLNNNTVTPIHLPVVEKKIIDSKLLNNYLFNAEQIMLEVANVDNEQDFSYILENNDCIRLLQKTLILREQALLLNNSQLVNLLDKIELLLLEIANCDVNNTHNEINSIRKNIEDFHIFVELRALEVI